MDLKGGRRVRRQLILVAALVALTGCVEATGGRSAQPSAAALAALPQGMNPGFLIRDSNGCWGLALEASATPTGIPLRDATGQQVCDGDAVT
ncbi:hypothetical protein SAMN04488011_10731 [Palleronia pelagia]|uniref:Uncharacterized protein n=1 Tax=Palleronia pelagia TaxID=387096 RepID=A0A1H8K127_9RHOB|nr:hypothetical protein SAMN04488011_10731 [Palleronia pelagia]